MNHGFQPKVEKCKAKAKQTTLRLSGMGELILGSQTVGAEDALGEI